MRLLRVKAVKKTWEVHLVGLWPHFCMEYQHFFAAASTVGTTDVLLATETHLPSKPGTLLLQAERSSLKRAMTSWSTK